MYLSLTLLLGHSGQVVIGSYYVELIQEHGMCFEARGPRNRTSTPSGKRGFPRVSCPSKGPVNNYGEGMGVGGVRQNGNIAGPRLFTSLPG